MGPMICTIRNSTHVEIIGYFKDAIGKNGTYV